MVKLKKSMILVTLIFIAIDTSYFDIDIKIYDTSYFDTLLLIVDTFLRKLNPYNPR